MNEEAKTKFSVGDLVVVSGDEDISPGSTGVVEELPPGYNAVIDIKGAGLWYVSERDFKHYTPVEDLPLWKANHMYLNDEQQQALRKLLHRVQWDEEYAKHINFVADIQVLACSFYRPGTDEGHEYWDIACQQCENKQIKQKVIDEREQCWRVEDDQCDNEEIQKPDEIRSRAMGGVVDELCPTVTPCTITIDGLNNTSEYFLQRAIDLQKERGKEYDNGQERSMGKIVEVFNIITGKQLSESEGWLFMQVLKDVRQWTKPEYHQDSAEDCVSYAALKAEALASGK